MEKPFKRIIVALLLSAFVASPALADRWVKIGEQKVNFRGDRDEILIGPDAGIFKRIKLKVEDAAVHFNDVVVVFGNDRRFDVPMRDNIPAGGETRAIDLPGDVRQIKKIIFMYKTRPGSDERATVSVLGYMASAASPASDDRWVSLGEQRVNFMGDKDEILIGPEAGRFKRIKLKVEDAAVHFNDVVVIFGNDERFNVPMPDNIPAGGETRVIDLPGEVRHIKKIILMYRTRIGSDERATVRVLGYKD